jgi:hypothetical protein
MVSMDVQGACNDHWQRCQRPPTTQLGQCEAVVRVHDESVMYPYSVKEVHKALLQLICFSLTGPVLSLNTFPNWTLGLVELLISVKRAHVCLFVR